VEPLDAEEPDDIVESVRCWHPKGFAVFSVAVAAAIAVCKSLPEAWRCN